jgi:sporulation protein YlmC with PRC-barrel domain
MTTEPGARGGAEESREAVAGSGGIDAGPPPEPEEKRLMAILHLGMLLWATAAIAIMVSAFGNGETGPLAPSSAPSLAADAATLRDVTTESNARSVDGSQRLMASTVIEGMAIYDRRGVRLGSVSALVLDLRSGQVAYAVLSLGGLPGSGDTRYPVPWKALAYDADRGGYVAELDKNRLQGAPCYPAGETPDWGNPAFGRRIDGFYGFSI